MQSRCACSCRIAWPIETPITTTSQISRRSQGCCMRTTMYVIVFLLCIAVPKLNTLLPGGHCALEHSGQAIRRRTGHIPTGQLSFSPRRRRFPPIPFSGFPRGQYTYPNDTSTSGHVVQPGRESRPTKHFCVPACSRWWIAQLSGQRARS